MGLRWNLDDKDLIRIEGLGEVYDNSKQINIAETVPNVVTNASHSPTPSKWQ